MFLGPAITFVVIAALLLWLIIGCRGKWWLKTFAIVGGTWYSVAIFKTLPTILGWPSPAPLPEKYEVYWVKVAEPIKGTDDKGCVYLWIQDMSKEKNKVNWWSLFKPSERDSRIHKLPYSRNLHKKANKIMQMLRKGQRVMGSGGKGKGKGKGKGSGKSGKGKTGGGDEGDDSVGPKFYKMPPVQLPRK